jgi:hypothetical protein
MPRFKMNGIFLHVCVYGMIHYIFFAVFAMTVRNVLHITSLRSPAMLAAASGSTVFQFLPVHWIFHVPSQIIDFGLRSGDFSGRFIRHSDQSIGKGSD